MNSQYDTGMLRAIDKIHLAKGKFKQLHHETRHDSNEFANDSVAEEFLDLNVDLLEKRKDRAKEVLKIKLNNKKSEGIQPDELTMGDINICFFDGQLTDDNMQGIGDAYSDDSDESENQIMEALSYLTSHPVTDWLIID